MTKGLLGIHHVTAVARDPQQNVDFYTGILGLRLVKVTVNFDAPTTYHLYYGDQIGHPGTILTFFPWPSAPTGLKGSGQLTATSFAVPEDALDYWATRFKRHDIPFRGPTRRFDEEFLSFEDPDGLQVELVADQSAERPESWKDSPIPAEYAVIGLYGMTLSEGGYEATSTLLHEILGFRRSGEEVNRFRYEVGGGGARGIIDVVCQPDAPQGFVGVGTVHHVAWRTPSDPEQREWRNSLVSAGLNVTPIIDRKYFHSIYFREPGGALFEIATDPPGFTIDEAPEQLGSRLLLPPWLEASRPQIEKILPALRLTKRVQAR